MKRLYTLFTTRGIVFLYALLALYSSNALQRCTTAFLSSTIQLWQLLWYLQSYGMSIIITVILIKGNINSQNDLFNQYILIYVFSPTANDLKLIKIKHSSTLFTTRCNVFLYAWLTLFSSNTLPRCTRFLSFDKQLLK